MSEIEAKERYYWSKIRQALKDGDVYAACVFHEEAWIEDESEGLRNRLAGKISATFTAGCIALGDPAPTDKENDHE